MRIAVLINTFYNGRGMDSVAEQQAKELADIGHEVTVFTFDNDHCAGEISIQRIGWPKSSTINYLYRLLFPLDIFKVKRYSRYLSKYDLVIAHFYPITYLAYRSKKENPNLHYIYYNHGFGNCSPFQPILRRLYLQLLRYLSSVSVSNVDGVISISYFIKKQLNLADSMEQVVYNKVDPERFAYQYTDIDSRLLLFSDQWKLAPKFLYVGTLSQSKGIELLIKSFRRVLQTYPTAKLLLVGKPTYGFSLSKYISDKDWTDTIYLFGQLDSHMLGYMYQTCDVCISASPWESFNLPLVEAQLLGKPVVAYNIGAHEEIVKDHVTGVLVEPFNTDKFAEAMIEVYKIKDIMGKNAKAWAYQFSVQNSDALTISEVVSAWY